MFLLDTDVVTELRRGATADAAVTAWASALAVEQLYLSAVALLDLEHAAARYAPREKAHAARLQRWIDEQVLPAFAGRIVPLDSAIVIRRRAVSVTDPRDALVAATALQHGMTLATHRTGAFKSAKLKLIDPWRYTAEEDLDWRRASHSEPHWLKTLFVRA
jgi:predicted nucleic acid-binding protein